MEYKIKFRENPLLTDEENEVGQESLDNFNEMFNTTCNIISTFRGNVGRTVIKKIIPVIDSSPELQQFIFELYCNTMAASRTKTIFNQ